MATIVNERDIILQATSPRLEQISSNNITLLASATTFTKVASGIQPSEITIKPILNGKLTGISSLTWTSSIANNLYTISADKIVTLPSGSVTFGTPVTFTATLAYLGNSYTASITLNNLQETIVSTLSKSSVNIATASDGSGGDYTAATSTMTVLVGNTDDSNNWTYSWSVPATVTATGGSTRTITVSAVSVSTPVTLTCTATKSGYTAQTKDFVITKSIAGATGPTGPQGTSITGPTGSSGLVGIAALTAYLVQSQSSSTPTFTTPTSGSAVPAGWSSTVPAVAIGQVLWYIQGRYNANAVTVDGVPANSTAWTGPIAASIFQSIRSDNYNGPTPPTISNFGTVGWYLDQPSGNLYANAAYLRGELVTGVSGAQRVEINKGVSNKVAVYNSSNTLLASFGGTGTSTDAILRLNPVIAGTTAYGATTVIPNPSGTNYVAASYKGQTTDANLEGVLCSWYTVGATTVHYGTAGTRDYGSGIVSGFLGYQDSAAYSAAVRGYNSAGGTEVSIADSAGYALNVRSGSIRYGSYTFSAFNGSTTQFLRGDGTFATPSGGTVTSVSGTGSVSGITLSGTVTTSGSLTLGGTISLSASDIPNLAGSKITSGIVSESYVGGFKNGTGTIVGIAGTGSTSVLNSFIGSDGATASDNFVLFTVSGSTYAGVFINQRGTTSTWSTFTSDARMKDVVGAIPVSSAIDAFKQIGKPVVWKWKFEQSAETWGYTAQQVGSGLPQALIESPVLPNGDYQKIPGTDERVLTFDNNKLQILKDLVIAELIAKVEALEARVGALEAK